MVPVPHGTLMGQIAQMLGRGVSIPDPNASPDVMLNSNVQDMNGLSLGGEPVFNEPKLMEPSVDYMGAGDEIQDNANARLLKLLQASQAPDRGSGMNLGELGAGIGGTLLLNLLDPKKKAGGEYAKAFAHASLQKKQEKWQKAQDKLNREIELGKIEAQMEGQKAERMYRMAEGQRKSQEFEREDATRRYVADRSYERGVDTATINAQRAAEVARIKGFMQGMDSKQKAAFWKANQGDPAVAEAFNQLTPKEKEQIANAGLKDAQTGLAREKTVTERLLRPDRQREIQAKAAMYESIPGVNRQKARNLALVTDLMPDRLAMDWAKAEAAIERSKAAVDKMRADIKHMPEELAVKRQNATTNQLAKEADVVKMGLDAVEKSLASLRSERAKLEGELNDAVENLVDEKQINHLRKAIKEIDSTTIALTKRRNQALQEAATIQKKMQESVRPSGSGSGGYEYRRNPQTGAIERVPKTEAGGPKARHSQNAALGEKIAATYGWRGAEWSALRELWTKESGWNHQAANPTSSARGIAQTMMSKHFGKNWQSDPRAQAFLSDPEAQIKWGLDYIKRRYGSPSRALGHWKSRVPIAGKDVGHWY